MICCWTALLSVGQAWMRATSCKSTSPGALHFALPCFKTGLFPEGERDNLTPLGGTWLLGRVSHSAASGCKTARFSWASFVSCEFVPLVAATCCAAFCAAFSILCATGALDSASSWLLLPKDLQAPGAAAIMRRWSSGCDARAQAPP